MSKRIETVQGNIEDWDILPAIECIEEMSKYLDVLKLPLTNASHEEMLKYRDCYFISACLLPSDKQEKLIIPNTIGGKQIVGIANGAFHHVIYGSPQDQYSCRSAENKDICSVTISEGIVFIGDNAFNSCSLLSSVVFPESLRRVGRAAFANCTSLKDVAFNESIISIGEWAFSNCTMIEELTLPNSLQTIQHCTFAGCSNLKGVGFPPLLKEIGVSAFASTDIRRVLLPEGLLILQDNAFLNVPSLRIVLLPRTLRIIGEIINQNQNPLFYVYPNSDAWVWTTVHKYKEHVLR